MNKINHILTAKNTFVAVLIVAAGLLAILAPKAAVNVDEQLHYPHAKKVVNWYFSGGDDISCLDTPVTNLKYYGQSVDNLTALINRVFNVGDEFLLRHYTGAVFFWLLLFIAGLLAHQITGNFWSSVLTVIIILLMPRIFGQAFGNLKDIPFATGYLWGILMITKFIMELPRPKWRTAILLGFAIAFTVSVRAGGFILFAYFALGMLFYLIRKPFYLRIVSTKPVLVRLLGQGMAIIFIGYFAGLLFWPYALQDVFVHPVESLRVMEHYSVSIRQIFQGEMMWSTQLPWYYLPVWLFISTPEFILAGFLLFMGFGFQQKLINDKSEERPFYNSFLLFTFLFPLVYVIVINSNLYSGIRQMMFTLPILAILAVIGIRNFYLWLTQFQKKWIYAATLAFLVLVFLPLKHQAMTFPADYIYFNAISGGNKNAWTNFEYDYYFHGIKEPANHLIDVVGDSKVKVAMNCNLSNYFDDFNNIEVIYTRYLERSSKDWDYGIFGINYIHPYLLKNNKWRASGTIKTFSHKGNPMAVVVKRKNKNDFLGINKMDEGNYNEGEELLLSALKNDPDNIWLYVSLAKNYLLQGEDENFLTYLRKGQEKFPYYEPFFLIKAQYFYNQNRFKKAKAELTRLFEINPRYKNAIALNKAVNNKLKLDSEI